MKEIAQGLAALGRGDDKVLVHMTPGEVQGLQKLAMSHGGSLTINPHTGLPEAGFLSSLLPTVLGVAGSVAFPGLSPWMLGAGLGGLTALTSGSLSKGLMAGLGAYGGAGLGSALNNVGSEAAGVLANQEATTAAKAAAEAERQAAIKAAVEMQNIPAQQANAANSWIGEYTNVVPANIQSPPSELSIGSSMPPQYQPVATPTPYTQQELTQIGDRAYQQAIDRSSMFGGATPAASTPAQNMQAGLGKVTDSWDATKKFITDNKGAVLGVAAPLGLAAYQSMSKQPTLNTTGAQAAPTRFYSTAYSPGMKNPRFGIPGEPYYIGQGYGRGTYDDTVRSAQGGLMSFAEGGAVPGYNPFAPFSQYPISGPFTSPMQHAGVQDYISALNSSLAYTPAAAPNPAAPTTTSTDGWTYDPVTHTFTPPTPKASVVDPNAGNKTAGQVSTGEIGGPGEAPGYGGSDVTGVGIDTGANTFSGIDAASNAGLSDADAAGYDVGGGGDSSGGGGGGEGNGPGGETGAGFEHGGGIHAGLGLLHGTYAAGGRLLRGPGDGMSDDIPAVINGPKPQRAALADGEFVIPADVVSHLGNGSTEAGSKRLYAMMAKVRHARTGNPKQGKQINPNKYMPA